MAKVKTYVSCLCGFKAGVFITKPRANSKQVGTTTCDTCLSSIGYEISASDKPNECTTRVTFIKPSPDLTAMIAEAQAEEKAKHHEEQATNTSAGA